MEEINSKEKMLKKVFEYHLYKEVERYIEEKVRLKME